MIIHASTPIAGFYRTRLVRGGPWVAVHLWHGPPNDPLTGELLDRSPRWQAELCGRPYDGDVLELWSHCAKHPIGASEHDYLLAIYRHAKKHESNMAEANPRKCVNYLKMPLIF